MTNPMTGAFALRTIDNLFKKLEADFRARDSGSD
jgi:hypothetical protein